MSKQASEATECQPLIKQSKKAGTSDVEAGDDDDTKPALTRTTTKARETILEDAVDILKISFPIFISSVSWVGVSSEEEDE